QHLFPTKIIVLALRGSGYLRHWLWLFLSEPINDPIPCDPKQPRTNLLDWLHQPVGFDKFREDVLQDVLSVLVIGDALAEKIAEARLFLPECLSDLSVFVIRPWLCRQRALQSTSVDELLC